MNAAEVPLLAQEQVGDHVEVVAQRQVLEHGGDAEGLGLGGTRTRHLAAVEGDVAAVGLVDPGDHLDQRGLAGAVVAHERHHLTGPDVQVDVGERLDGAESLVDAGQGEDTLPDRRGGARWGRHQVMPAASHAVA